MRKFILVLMVALGFSVGSAVCGELGTAPQNDGQSISPESLENKKAAEAVFGRELKWIPDGYRVSFGGNAPMPLYKDGKRLGFLRPEGKGNIYDPYGRNNIVGHIDDIVPPEHQEEWFRQLLGAQYDSWVAETAKH